MLLLRLYSLTLFHVERRQAILGNLAMIYNLVRFSIVWIREVCFGNMLGLAKNHLMSCFTPGKRKSHELDLQIWTLLTEVKNLE